MYFDRIVKAFKDSKLTQKQLAEKSQVSEKTISRMLTSRDYHATFDIMESVTNVLGISMQELFSETDAVVVSRDTIFNMEELQRTEEENKLLSEEISALKERVSELSAEIASLRMKLEHKEGIISVHESYKSLLDGLARIITDSSTATQ